MKKAFLSLLLFCIVKVAFPQGQLSIGSPGTAETFIDSKYDQSDGGTINVGIITTTANDPDCYIVKLNSTGNIVWQRRFVNASGSVPGYNECFKKVIVCANGDYLAIGNYLDNTRIRGFVCRFNKNTGAVIWSVTSGNFPAVDPQGKGQVYTDVTETAAGNIAIVGSWDWVVNNAQGHSRGIALLLNSTGGELWCRERTGTDDVNNEYLTVNQLPNGNLLLTGIFDQDSRKAMVILQVNENTGNIVNTRTYTVSAPGTYINTVPINTSLNALWAYRTYVDAATGNATIGVSAFTDYGSVGTAVNTIYTYNPTTLVLSGNFYYHPNSSAARAFAFYPLATNDFLISESVTTSGALNTYFSRMQAGVRLYDRNITNATGNVGNIAVFNSNFNMVGTAPTNGGDAYALFSPVAFPITGQNTCGINNINTLLAVPNTAQSTPNASTFTARTATRVITPGISPTLSAVNIICGVPPDPCPIDTSYTVTKCSSQAITLSARAGTTYSWSPATGLSATNIQNPVCTATTSTTYTVTITNTATNCTYKDIINVVVSPNPISNLRDTSVCVGDTIQLTASGGTSYSWTPNYNISNTTIANPLVWPGVTTTYIVTITNAAGCSASDTVIVAANICHCEDSCNWSLTGNTYVKPYNFIGSLNNADFKVRTNNTQRMVVSAGGNVGINTPTPSKLLDVNGEARVAVLPATTPNQSIVFADAAGNLKSLQASGNTNEYLSGNGTWQPAGTGGGTVNAAFGLTMYDPTTVVLGANCGEGGGEFRNNRQVNMNNQNLYFNTSNLGKVRIGNDNYKEILCPELYTRLELDTRGLRDAVNDYASPNPSPSGLRFSQLTSATDPIPNKTKGVLSLDEDGDVIWVATCCDKGGLETAETTKQIGSILDRLTKLEAELEKTKQQVAQMDVLLEKNNIIVLGQNTPNPFTESTVINYSIPRSFGRAQLIFTATNGEVVKTADIKVSGKGQVNVFASDLTSGLYTYTLIIDGKVIETKKMIKH